MEPKEANEYAREVNSAINDLVQIYEHNTVAGVTSAKGLDLLIRRFIMISPWQRGVVYEAFQHITAPKEMWEQRIEEIENA